MSLYIIASTVSWQWISSYTHMYNQLLLSFRMSSSWHHHIDH